jgi:cell division protein FtsB
VSRQAPARPDSLRSVLGAAVLLALALLAVASVKSHRDLAAAQAREQALETTIEATKGRIATLRNRIERLRHDPGTLERLAREDLGMVRPHDLVIALPADGPLPPKRPASKPEAPVPAARATMPAPAPPVPQDAASDAASGTVAAEPASLAPAASVPASAPGPAAPSRPPSSAPPAAGAHGPDPAPPPP